MEALSCFRPFSSIPHASLRYRSSLAFCTNCSVVNVVPRKPLNKYVGLSMHHQRLEFCGLSYDIKLQKHCQLLRNIVARSELAGTESHDAAAYTLTGFRLGSKFRGVSFYADCLKCCMDLVRKGASVFFFPEGTRSKYGKLGVFKKGAFSVVAKTGVPVIPITLIGTGKLMPVGKEVSLNSGSVKVVIHKPLEGNNAGILCEKARKAIADDLFLLG